MNLCVKDLELEGRSFLIMLTIRRKKLVIMKLRYGLT